MADDLFAPPTGAWQRVAPGYIHARRWGTLVTWVTLFAVPTVLAAVFASWEWAVGVAVVALVVVVWRVIRVKALCLARGYVEEADELYVTSGILFQSLTMVPYGRLQVIEVERGLFDRWFGTATVHMVTASSDTDANIPGLTPDDALSLRDRLADRSDPYTSGL